MKRPDFRRGQLVERFQRTVYFSDSDSLCKTNPKGISSLFRPSELAKADSTSLNDPAECQFVAPNTNSPYLNHFACADVGKTAHYLLRWVSTRGDKGPRSEIPSATICGGAGAHPAGRVMPR